MDNKMKYRIIGIGVLVLALAVIIVPLFFGHSEKGPKLSSHIPNPPAKPETQLAIPTVPQDNTEDNGAQMANANTPSSDSGTALPQTTNTNNTAIVATTNNNSPAETQGINSAPQTDATNASPAAVSTPAVTLPIEKTGKAVKEQRNKSGAIKSKYAGSYKRHHEVHMTSSKLKSAELAQAWTVQLASFSQKANAEVLIKRLRAKGFPAYLHEIKTGKEPVLRVFVGPELHREKAQQLVERLRTEFGMRGLVVKYRV